jgi:hypothetical protein
VTETLADRASTNPSAGRAPARRSAVSAGSTSLATSRSSVSARMLRLRSSANGRGTMRPTLNAAARATAQPGQEAGGDGRRPPHPPRGQSGRYLPHAGHVPLEAVPIEREDQPLPKVNPAGIATPKPAATGTKRKVSPKVKRQGTLNERKFPQLLCARG